MAHDVFISYSSKNKATADAICHVLEEHEIKCWIAPRDIVGGEKYGEVIEEAIKSCKVFVIIFSEESRISPWVESELNLAFTDRRTIVPFKIDSSLLEGEMRLILNNKHWIEAYPNPEHKFKDLIEAVSRSIGKPTLNEAEKLNMEVQKQLEIENTQQPNAEKQNVNGNIDSQNDSKLIYEENLPNTKKITLITLTLIVIVVFLMFVFNKNTNRNDNDNEVVSPIEYVDSIAIDTLAADTGVIIQNDNLNEARTKTNTNKTGTFTDSRDGHVYKWVKIGNQIWMAENLAYKCSDGCWAYDNDASNARKYGYLYNWETAKKVCPKGWHLPSNEEWKDLEKYLIQNGYNYDESKVGNKIGKSLASNYDWERHKVRKGLVCYNQQTNNRSGFNALPAGFYIVNQNGEKDNNIFSALNYAALWWTSTEGVDGYKKDLICIKQLNCYSEFLEEVYSDRTGGQSIRCVKDRY